MKVAQLILEQATLAEIEVVDKLENINRGGKVH